LSKQLNARTIALMVILAGMIIYYLFTSGLISFDSEDSENLFGLSVGSSSSALTAREASKFRTATPLRAVIWKSDWESDPFYYAEAETTDALGGGLIGSIFETFEGGKRPSLTITGISWAGNVGMALINGDILEEGDRVAGYQITKIAFGHVILRRGTSIVKVSLDD